MREAVPTRGSTTSPGPRPGEVLATMEPTVGEPGVGAGLLCLEFSSLGRQLRRDDLTTTAKELRLTQWLDHFGLPGPVGGVTEHDLARVDVLSAAIDQTARSLMASDTPDASLIRTLNEFADHPTPVFLLRRDGRQRTSREENSTVAAFSVVARDAINTFATADLRRLRSCAGCDLLFYDRSPSGQRRWCSMKRCGERVASASYRQRHATKAALKDLS